jgi:hypothetical protein
VSDLSDISTRVLADSSASRFRIAPEHDCTGLRGTVEPV